MESIYYFFNALGLFTGVLIAGTAWTLLKHKHRHAPQALTSSSVATPPNGR